MKLQIKQEYKGQILSNSKVGQFEVNNITEELYQFYFKNGFSHIFEEIIEEITEAPDSLLDIAKKEVENFREFKPKSRGKKDESNN